MFVNVENESNSGAIENSTPSVFLYFYKKIKKGGGIRGAGCWGCKCRIIKAD
jgi:hypothetical protein